MIHRAVVIDDEPWSRAAIRDQIRGYPDFEVVAECSSGGDALTAVRALQPNVLFLDVRMPGLTGLDVAVMIRGDSAPVMVIVTAYQQYAVAAFELEALDYLLKPIDPERFGTAVNRIRRRLLSAGEREQGGGTTPSNRSATLRIRNGRRTILLDHTVIDWVSASKDHVEIRVGQTRHVMRCTMAAVEQLLASSGAFIRVHRSALVNRDRIVEIVTEPSGNAFVRLASGDLVPMSRRRRI